MAASRKISPAMATIALILMTLAGECLAQLQVGFYKGKCGKSDVEKTIFDLVKAEVAKDPTLPAALLRMQFHDCFVRGCDASLLLDGGSTEKTAGPNGSVRGYEVIEAIKAALEKVCPGVVSCSDVLVIATRATVFLAKGSWYDVETGRRDGVVSLDSDANANLPGPTISIPAAVQAFASKGLDTETFVLLLGGHTIGVAHCSLFQDRLYTFNGVAGSTDPSMHKGLVRKLKQICPQSGDGTNFASLDQSSARSANVMGNGFVFAIRKSKGVLQVDQDMAFHSLTSSIVAKYAANNTLFNTDFGKAMVKLGRVEVLTGSQGNIRTTCGSTN